MIDEPSNIPGEWTLSTLAQATIIEMGQSPPGVATNQNGEGVPLVGGASDIGKLNPNPSKYTTAPTKQCQVNDLILCIRATIGKVCFADKIYCLGRGVAGLRPVLVNKDWILHFIKLSEQKLVSLGTGTTFKQIDKKILSSFEIPIPPLNEQERITKKIESLQLRSSKARKALGAIPLLLEKFRQSVLASAFRGDLTADWRAQNPDIESTSKLLERTRKERRMRWEKDELAKMKARSKTPKDDKWKKKYKEPDPLETAKLKNLPISWVSVALDELCRGFSYGSSSKSASKGKIPVLRMGNIQNGEIDWNDLVYSSNDDEVEKYSLQPDTVLFNRTNSPELVGKTAIYRGERPAIFAGYLIKCETLSGLNPEYLNYVLNASFSRIHCLRVKSDSVSQSNINATKLGRFEIPFCSLEEQEEIVRQVKKTLKLQTSVKDRISELISSVESLDQSILSKAFLGELCPQDPKDEPASQL